MFHYGRYARQSVARILSRDFALRVTLCSTGLAPVARSILYGPHGKVNRSVEVYATAPTSWRQVVQHIDVNFFFFIIIELFPRRRRLFSQNCAADATFVNI